VQHSVVPTWQHIEISGKSLRPRQVDLKHGAMVDNGRTTAMRDLALLLNSKHRCFNNNILRKKCVLGSQLTAVASYVYFFRRIVNKFRQEPWIVAVAIDEMVVLLI